MAETNDILTTRDSGTPYFMDLMHLQDSIRRKRYSDAGISTTTAHSDVLDGLASGLDAVLTIMEASCGAFDELSPEAAIECSKWFRSESDKYRSVNLEISIWYLSWAEAVENRYLDPK
jgi:hypothetical protein